MEIYTSYYAKVNRMNTDDCLLIRISSSAPKWFNKPCAVLPELYPDWSLINGIKNGTMSEEEYTQEYTAIFTDELKESVLSKVQALLNSSGKSKAVLLCWCTGFCHRHLVNDWLGGKGEM